MLNQRILKVTITMPGGGDVILDEGLDLHVRVRKAALALQNAANVVVVGLARGLREQLLSQFTAWNNRQVNEGIASQKWVKIKIEAGYTDPEGKKLSAIIFRGEVATVAPVEGPPDIGVEITAYTRQIDKTTFITSQPPIAGTLEYYTQWAAEQLGLGENWICDTSYNKMVLENAFVGFHTMAGLIWALQDTRKPDIVAFIDDDFLVVKDRNKVVNPSDILVILEFVDTPSWDEYGVAFTTLFDTSIRLAGGVQLQSIMNPSVNGPYVLTMLDYDLSSRDGPFHVNSYGSPPSA